MLIRCWGARGSLPISGADYLKYGGDTSCLELRPGDGEVIILDAGTGIRPLGKLLTREGRTRLHLVFTHAHMDHVMGLPFFEPLYSGKTELHLYGCPFAQDSVRKMVARLMSPPTFPVDFEKVKAVVHANGYCASAFSIGATQVTPILLSHPNQGIGYRIEEDGKRFVFLTDNELTHPHPGGLAFEDYRDFCRGADVLFHDAQYTVQEYEQKQGWGHSRYTDALRLALDAGVRRLGLFHHDYESTDADIDRIVDDCRRTARERGSALEVFAVYPGLELTL